jgi:hypothetical protein
MTHIRNALALLGAVVLLAPAVGNAGPTVKKRAWQTIGFALESTRVGPWGPGYGNLEVPLNGSGASDTEVQFAGGVTGTEVAGGAKAIWLAATFQSATNDPPDLPPIEGMRFWVTLTGACGTASMTALP